MGRVVLQMGHVPRRTGKTGAPGEQEYARLLAGNAAARLRRVGHEVLIISADPDTYPRSADAFIAIHYDGSTNSSARGASVGYQNANGQKFGAAWKTAYQRQGWPSGFRADNYTEGLRGYYGVRRAIAAGARQAIIIECGFSSNKRDNDWMHNHVDRAGQAITDAVGDVIGHPKLAATTHAAGAWQPTFPIKSGQKNHGVLTLQRTLKGQGFSGLLADGVFGPATSVVVREFQRRKSLTVDGIVGPATWAALRP